MTYKKKCNIKGDSMAMWLEMLILNHKSSTTDVGIPVPTSSDTYPRQWVSPFSLLYIICQCYPV